MSVKSEIYTALTSDSSLASYVGTNIYLNYLPMNQDVSANSLVYSSRVAGTIHTINDRDLGAEHSFTVKIVSTCTVNVEAINKEVRRTMQAYSSDTIPDVIFERDNDVYDQDNELHTESLDFTVWYYNF